MEAGWWMAIGMGALAGWGLLDLLLRAGAARLARAFRAWRRRGRPVFRPGREGEGEGKAGLRLSPLLPGGALVGMGAGGLLLLLGTGGIWPLMLPGMGLAGGALAEAARRWRAGYRRVAAQIRILEEIALLIPATGSLEAALRIAAGAAAPDPVERALRTALAQALDEALRRGGGALEAVEGWARRADPETLGPVAAAVRAATAGGGRVEEVLLRAADEAAAERTAELAARLRALPDTALPVVGLGMFAPILGLIMVPLAARLLALIARTGGPALPIP